MLKHWASVALSLRDQAVEQELLPRLGAGLIMEETFLGLLCRA